MVKVKDIDKTLCVDDDVNQVVNMTSTTRMKRRKRKLVEKSVTPPGKTMVPCVADPNLVVEASNDARVDLDGVLDDKAKQNLENIILEAENSPLNKDSNVVESGKTGKTGKTDELVVDPNLKNDSGRKQVKKKVRRLGNPPLNHTVAVFLESEKNSGQLAVSDQAAGTFKFGCSSSDHSGAAMDGESAGGKPKSRKEAKSRVTNELSGMPMATSVNASCIENVPLSNVAINVAVPKGVKDINDSVSTSLEYSELKQPTPNKKKSSKSSSNQAGPSSNLISDPIPNVDLSSSNGPSGSNTGQPSKGTMSTSKGILGPKPNELHNPAHAGPGHVSNQAPTQPSVGEMDVGLGSTSGPIADSAGLSTKGSKHTSKGGLDSETNGPRNPPPNGPGPEFRDDPAQPKDVEMGQSSGPSAGSSKQPSNRPKSRGKGIMGQKPNEPRNKASAQTSPNVDESGLGSNPGQPKADPKPFAGLFKDNRAGFLGMKLSLVKVDDDAVRFDAHDQVPFEDTWGFCLIGCFTGQFPGRDALNSIVKGWKVSCRTVPYGKGWTIFRFKNEEERHFVFNGGPYMAFGKTLMLKLVDPNIVFTDDMFTKVPTWVLFRDVPWSIWSETGLSKLASKVGAPFVTDKITKEKSRLGYARCLIEVDASKPPLTEFPCILPNGTRFLQQVEYEHYPSYCHKCKVFGHNHFSCPSLQTQVEKETVFVFGAKQGASSSKVDKNATKKPMKNSSPSNPFSHQGPSAPKANAKGSSTTSLSGTGKTGLIGKNKKAPKKVMKHPILHVQKKLRPNEVIRVPLASFPSSSTNNVAGMEPGSMPHPRNKNHVPFDICSGAPLPCNDPDPEDQTEDADGPEDVEGELVRVGENGKEPQVLEENAQPTVESKQPNEEWRTVGKKGKVIKKRGGAASPSVAK